MNEVLEELPLHLHHWHLLFMKFHPQDYHEKDSSERLRKLRIFKENYDSMENIDDLSLSLSLSLYIYIYIYTHTHTHIKLCKI